MPSFHRWSADLVALTGLTFFATVVISEGGFGVPALRLVVLPVLLFAPGYALLSLLFPEDPQASKSTQSDAPSLGLVERFSLSVALSVGIVPMVALGLNFTSYGIRARPVMYGVFGVVAVCSILALVARLRVPAEQRFGMGAGNWIADVNSNSLRTANRSLEDRGLFDLETKTQRVVALALVGSVLVFGASIAFAATVPPPPSDDEQFTEFYVLGETEAGNLSAEAVPTAFEPGGSRTVHVAVRNHERHDVEYTTVVAVQRASVDGGDVTVRESKELDRFTMQVGAGESERVERQVSPSLSGEDLRLVFLLYEGDPPADPSVENAYRAARVWVTVGGGGGGDSSGQVRPGTHPPGSAR